MLGHGHSQALAASAAGAANAVHVVLGLHGQAKVEHVRDGGHINATGRHVGGHQNLHTAIAQRHQTAVAQTLAQGTVQRHGRKADLLQVLGQRVALNLGAGKHNGLIDAGIAQPVVQQLALVLGAVAPVELLLDVAVAVLRRIDLHLLRLAHDAGRQCLDARCEGGTEHHGLVARYGELVDFGQVIGKAEVEHAVGFVHHQELHFIELDLPAALQVEQAAGRSHHEVGVLQLGNLNLVGNTTHHVGNAQATAMAHQIDGVVGYLLGQFAGRAKNQGTRHGGLEVAGQQRVLALRCLGGWLAFGGSLGSQTLALGAFRSFGGSLLLEQGMQNGQQESGSFAATGLAGHHEVGVSLGRSALALHGLGNDGLLHQRGLGEGQVCHGLHQLGGQAQRGKRVGAGRFGLGRLGLGGGNSVAAVHVVGQIKSGQFGGIEVSHVVRPGAQGAIDRNRTTTQQEAAAARLIRSWSYTHQPSNRSTRRFTASAGRTRLGGNSGC